MKKYILALLVSLMMVAGISYSAVPSKIVGLSGECDTTNAGCIPIPLILTTLCTASCPIRSSFSYTSSSRFWGASSGAVGACQTSIDGGITWGGCTTQAFSSGSGGESYAGASDGSVIAIGSITGTCTIKRSIDNAANWTTVFTDANACFLPGQPGQNLWCLSDSRCEYQMNNGGTARVYRSSDNGANWVQGTTGTGGNCTIVGTQWDGSAGIMPSENTGCGGGNIAKTWVAAADVWTDSVTWTGAQGDCWTPVVYNSTGRVICNAGAALTMYSSAGASVAVLILPTSLVGLDSQGPAWGWATNTLYIAAQNVTTGIDVHVSRDNLVSFTKLGTFTGGGAGPRGGNMFAANGCIYVTTGLTPMFGKVC